MSDSEKSRKSLRAGTHRVSLSTPWGGSQTTFGINNTCEYDANGAANEFVRERTRLHELYLREEAKSKRLGLILGFLLVAIAGTCVQFAPAGREVLSYWIGGALVIFAAGSCGFGRVWGKVSRISFGADRGDGGSSQVKMSRKARKE